MNTYIQRDGVHMRVKKMMLSTVNNEGAKDLKLETPC